jgi:hypothetical protein
MLLSPFTTFEMENVRRTKGSQLLKGPCFADLLLRNIIINVLGFLVAKQDISFAFSAAQTTGNNFCAVDI